MRHVEFGFLCALVSALSFGCDSALIEFPAQDFATTTVGYECVCGCDAQVLGFTVPDVFSSGGLKVCLPEEFRLTAEEIDSIPGGDKACRPGDISEPCVTLAAHCERSVCPNVERVAREWAQANPQRVREMIEEDGHDSTFWGDDSACSLTCKFRGTRLPQNNADCGGTCEAIRCAGAPELPLNEDGTPDFSNAADCTYFGIGGNCPGLQTTPVCLNPSGEPPVLTGGVMAKYFVPRTAGVFDSESKIRVKIEGENFTVGLTGSVEFVGEPCPGQSCELGLSIRAHMPNPKEFHGVMIRDGRITGGSGNQPLFIDESGSGALDVGEARITLTVFLNNPDNGQGEQATGVWSTNRTPVYVDIDWQARKFHITDGFKLFNDPETIVTMDIVGTLTDFPPKADAGDDRVVECNVHGGATITLDGSQSHDEDDDIVASSWNLRRIDGSRLVGNELIMNTIAPLGENQYLLSVTDSRFQQSIDSTRVNVQDTIPPQIESFALTGPSCLWAPNHKYAVLRVDRDFQAVITDTCDPNPFLALRSATSNQPDNDRGDGNTRDDVVIFPDRICLRAERSASDFEDRLYAISVLAVDESGNTNDPVVEIRVPHDQRDIRSGSCPDVTPVELVMDGDPICDPEIARQEMEAFWGERSSQTAEAPLQSESRGCSSVGTRAPVGYLFFMLVLLVSLRGKRRRLA